jgi:MFS transporter, UMF1 family
MVDPALNVIESAPKSSRRGILGWMFFDWAAQPFFTVVTTFIFGPYFVARLTEDPIAAQAQWSNAATIASLVIAIFSPVLGSIADATGEKKRWIAFFAAIKIVSLTMLWFAAPGSPIIYPMIFWILASISAEFSIVFNDSMMPRLIPEKDVGRISNLAWGLGYLGGMIVLFAVILLLAGNPATGKTLLGIAPLFGLDPALGEDARITGPISAAWYFIFILPMFFFTPDVKGAGIGAARAVREGLTDLREALGELARTKRNLARFLIGRMIYQDGVNALIVLGGAFAAGMFGWATIEIGIYGIILNIVAIGSNIVAGWLDRQGIDAFRPRHAFNNRQRGTFCHVGRKDLHPLRALHRYRLRAGPGVFALVHVAQHQAGGSGTLFRHLCAVRPGDELHGDARLLDRHRIDRLGPSRHGDDHHLPRRRPWLPAGNPLSGKRLIRKRRPGRRL